MKINPEFVGDWRITEMSQWDKEYIDLVAPGHLSIEGNGTGAIAFGAVEAGMDCRMENIGEQRRVAFSFAGSDEYDEVSGRGWAVVNGKGMAGWFAFFQGDASTFRAMKQRAGKK